MPEQVKIKYRKTILTIIILSLAAGLSAQMKGGYQFGINLTTISFTPADIISKTEVPMGIHFGIYYDIALDKHVSIQSGFLFSSKGADYEIDTVDYSLTPTYLEIPVNLAFHLGSEKTIIYLFGGPYAACAIGGYKIVTGDELRYLNFGGSAEKDMKRFDFGINLGIGVSVKSYVISAQYGIGLTNTSSTNDYDMKNNVVGISLSSLR
jgi:hypothetical protein